MLNESAITLELKNGNQLCVSYPAAADGLTYAFYIWRENQPVAKTNYDNKSSFIYWLTEPGSYHATVFVKQGAEKTTYRSENINFTGITHDATPDDQPKPASRSWSANIKNLLREVWQNRKRMLRIAQYDYRIQYKDTYLGRFWSVFNPLIQIATFWFVFGFGIRNGQPVDGHPFLIWMLCGLIPWFFINTAIVRGAGSVFAKTSTVLKLRYPISTIPIGSVIVALFDQLIMLGLLFIVLICFGYMPTLYWLNLLYYIFYAFTFLSLLALITSTLTMLARDFQKLINSLMRLLFYITPILWTIDYLPPFAQTILRINPVFYITDGFRDSLIYQVSFYQHPGWLAFFWLINLLLLVIGCNLQSKFQDQFIDLI